MNKPDFQYAGHTFKVINPLDPQYIVLRRNDFFLEEYARDWGLEKSDLLKIIGRTINEGDFKSDEEVTLAKAINKIADIKTILTQIYMVINEDYQYKPYLKSASIIILLDDEKPKDDYHHKLQEKLTLCEQHPEIEAFFLGIIKVFHSKLTNKPLTTETSESLEGQKGHLLTEKALLALINSTRYKIGEK